MIESIFVFKSGVIVDLHYLIAVRPESNTYWVDFYYQLLPKPAKLSVGHGLSRSEYIEDMEKFAEAWEVYKVKQGR